MAVTLRQIANAAGLSVSAVSQIINRRECNFCSAARKNEVINIARELGYKQKFADKIKCGESTRTVAILKRNNLTMEVNSLIMLMLSLFEKIGYSCYVVNFPKNSDVLPRVQDMIDRGVERFVIMGAIFGGKESEDMKRHRELISLLKRNHRTYVDYGDSRFHCVMQDFAPAVRATVKFFHKCGVENFRMMLPESGGRRETALHSCFPELSPEEFRQKYLFHLGDIYSLDTVDDMVKTGYCKTAELLTLYPETRGIYYLADQFALGGVNYLLEHGITPGKDILLAGFNDFAGVRYCGYPVSTAAHDLEALAEALVEESGKSEENRILIAPKIILRKDPVALI